MNEAEIAERIAHCIEFVEVFESVDWNDLGEVTVRADGKTYRMTVHNITDAG